MNDLRELYQETILDHNRDPRNFRILEEASHKAEGFNPLCGDHFSLYLKVDGDLIADISFQGSGCAISKSSASIMTTLLKGKTVEEAKVLFEQLHTLLTSEELTEVESLGKLAVFAGVREFPARVKCASLAWHTLISALDNSQMVVSTE